MVRSGTVVSVGSFGDRDPGLASGGSGPLPSLLGPPCWGLPWSMHFGAAPAAVAAGPCPLLRVWPVIRPRDRACCSAEHTHNGTYAAGYGHQRRGGCRL